MSADKKMETRLLIEALHAQAVEHEKLLRIIVPLGQGHDKAFVVKVFADALAEAPDERDDVVLLGNLALRFDNDGMLTDAYKAVPGTTKRADVVIVSDADM